MKNTFTLFIAAVIVIVLLIYMFCFVVRYDEVAVVTTFEKAEAPTFAEDGKVTNPGSVRYEPGLYFQWPWPIQKVTKYKTLVRVLDGPAIEKQTKDRRVIVAKSFVTWKITEPYAFFRRLKDVENAKRQLRPIIEETQSVLSEYRFDQLVNTDPAKLALRDIEKAALEKIRERVEAQGYGIEIVSFGIRRNVLPEEITPTVFERMKKDREALAENTKASGEAEAQEIRSRANSAKVRIEAFARARASEIETRGELAAAQYLEKFAQDEALAIALLRFETLKQILKDRTTVILSADQIWLDKLFPNWAQEGVDKLDAGPTSHRDTKAGDASAAVMSNPVLRDGRVVKSEAKKGDASQ